MNPDMSEPVSIHTEVPIWTDLNRGIIFMCMQSRAHRAAREGWSFINIPSHRLNETLSSGLGLFFSTQINTFLSAASAHQCRGSRMVNNSMRPPPQR